MKGRSRRPFLFLHVLNLHELAADGAADVGLADQAPSFRVTVVNNCCAAVAVCRGMRTGSRSVDQNVIGALVDLCSPMAAVDGGAAVQALAPPPQQLGRPAANVCSLGR